MTEQINQRLEKGREVPISMLKDTNIFYAYYATSKYPIVFIN